MSARSGSLGGVGGRRSQRQRRRRGRLVAVDIESERIPDTLPGMAGFAETFRPTRKLPVGGDVESFPLTPVENWLSP